MNRKTFRLILLSLLLLPGFHPGSSQAQTAVSTAMTKAVSTPLINTSLARDEEEYYGILPLTRKPKATWGAVILMGLAWGGFLTFFTYKFLKTKPRSPEAVNQDEPK